MTITGVQTTYTAFPAIAYAGQREGTANDDVISGKNVDTGNMPFGIGVVWKTSGATSDIDMKLPATQNDLVAGIVIHSHTHPLQWTDNAGVSHGELSATGLVPTTIFNVLRRGKIAVVVPTGCKPSDRLFIRAVANGAISNQLGSTENASDSTNMIDCTKQGQFLTTAAANGFAWLDVNFTAKP